MTSSTRKQKSAEEINKKLQAQNEKLKDSVRCFHCGSLKPRKQFYISTDPQNKAGVTVWCKQCCRDVAYRKDEYGQTHGSTVESVQKVLKAIDKPFIRTVWEASVDECTDETVAKPKNDPWNAYIKNIQMKNYYGMKWENSDMFRMNKNPEYFEPQKKEPQKQISKDAYADYIKNKTDVVRMLGYDPFDKESDEDQPFLYSQLIGMLDSSQDSNDDMVRISSAISIVRGFLQESKIDDAITKLMGDVTDVADNSATIKSLQESKTKITTMITSLAKESCLSLNNSKTVTKGTNTWTGKIAKIRELNLREGEVNGFDINTCKGFQQVQEISDASIMKQLRLDESEWSDMVADMREANQKLRQQKSGYQEINRILLRENLDLKDTLAENGIDVKDNTVNLKDIYSPFMDQSKDEEQEEGDSDESDNSSV